MSDWMDLRLAHSLTPLKAPDALWSRVNAGIGAATAAERPRATGLFRWGVPCAVAAAVVLLASTTTMELRPPHAAFVSNDSVAVEHWLAHEAGVAVPIRPVRDGQVKGARMVRRGVATVDYEVNGHLETVTVSCGGTVTVASNTGRNDATCKNCHSL